jgi:tetratricopeptide (TPR) repeat protein
LGHTGHFDEAILMHQTALQLHPNDGLTLFNLGMAYQSKTDLTRAATYYRQAIRAMPELWQPYNNLAVALFQQGHTDEAITTLRGGLRAVPNDPELQRSLRIMLAPRDRSQPINERR